MSNSSQERINRGVFSRDGPAVEYRLVTKFTPDDADAPCSSGRAQELLGSVGGKDAWCAFEPFIAESDWSKVYMLSCGYFKLFRL